MWIVLAANAIAIWLGLSRLLAVFSEPYLDLIPIVPTLLVLNGLVLLSARGVVGLTRLLRWAPWPIGLAALVSLVPPFTAAAPAFVIAAVFAFAAGREPRQSPGT